MSMNRAILIGRLGQDPEIRYGNSGNPIATFNLATSESWKNKQTGEREQRTEWHRVVVFNTHKIDYIENHFKKGNSVTVEGKIKTRRWTDQNGSERYTTEIVVEQFDGNVFLNERSQNSNHTPDESDYGYSSNNKNQKASTNNKTENNNRNNGFIDDDIPF